jgi:NAD(P)H-dependent FMN reductase
MARLLVVHHSPTPTVQGLTDAVLAGTHDEAIEGVEVLVRTALEATADDVLAADGYLLGTTANFGYMSGALKHFFDTIFLEAGGALSDDGSARSVLSIVGALSWSQAAEVLEVLGDVDAPQRAAAYELGATLAALLA